jgi:hypothetical protein
VTSTREDRGLGPIPEGQRAAVIPLDARHRTGLHEAHREWCPWAQPPHEWLGRLLIAWVSDPDGNPIQIVQPSTPNTHSPAAPGSGPPSTRGAHRRLYDHVVAGGARSCRPVRRCAARGYLARFKVCRGSTPSPTSGSSWAGAPGVTSSLSPPGAPTSSCTCGGCRRRGGSSRRRCRAGHRW